MTRDELKDGKWYLIKIENWYEMRFFDLGKLHGKGDCELDAGKIIDPLNETEWVEIDPEEIFKLKSLEKYNPYKDQLCDKDKK